VAAGLLVDSNVLLDVLTEDPRWYEWSASALTRAAEHGRLFLNPIILAEISIGFHRIEELDAALPELLEWAELPREAAFLAGKVFLRYRRSGGTKTSTLPDFFIGAHAAVADLTLLTRDARRYRRYFPTLELVSP
jgi:predicted nucleic acid-binding protein